MAQESKRALRCDDAKLKNRDDARALTRKDNYETENYLSG